MRILNVIIYFDNGIEVSRYIDEIKRVDSDSVDIAVVINRDTKGEAEEIVAQARKRYGNNIAIKRFGGNVGYMNALLKCIDDETVYRYDYVILSNTDIKYNTEEFFSKLLNREYCRKIGCIAPSVYSTATMSYSNPHYKERIAKQKYIMLSMIFSNKLLSYLYMRLSSLKAKESKKQRENSQIVYAPHGCYIILRREFIRHLKGKEFGALLYSEEAFIAEELIRAGLNCYYDSELEVIHTENSVTGLLDATKRLSMWRDSIKYILSEYY